MGKFPKLALMTSNQLKKSIMGGATILGAAVLVTAGLRANERSKSGEKFGTAFANELQKVVSTKTA